MIHFSWRILVGSHAFDKGDEVPTLVFTCNYSISYLLYLLALNTAFSGFWTLNFEGIFQSIDCVRQVTRTAVWNQMSTS